MQNFLFNSFTNHFLLCHVIDYSFYTEGAVGSP